MYTFYHACESHAKYTHTHNTNSLGFICDSFGVVKFFRLRGEGRKGWEQRVKNGVRMKHMIPVDYIEFSFC